MTVTVTAIAAVVVSTIGSSLLFQTWAARPARETEEV